MFIQHAHVLIVAIVAFSQMYMFMFVVVAFKCS